MFAQFGLPITIVTDNGSSFTSEEFSTFLAKNGISHITSAPYHPSSNGLAERTVQSLKQGLKKLTQGTITDRLSRFLYHYRNTLHTMTKVTPAELLLSHKPWSHMDLLRPNLSSRVLKRQEQQKQTHDTKVGTHQLAVGDLVSPGPIAVVNLRGSQHR